MRIAFVPAARLLSEREPNGEALIATALMRGLAERGHDILAYCERSDLDPIPGIEIREIPVEGPTVSTARLRFARTIAADVALERIDVAHLLFPFTVSDGYSFVRTAPLVAGPINVSWPGGHHRASGLRRVAVAAGARAERRAHARTIATAARLLVVGDSARHALPSRAHARCEDVPFGVDVQRIVPRPFPQAPTIVFPSVVQARKGIETLIRAMPLIVHRIPRARLIVAGNDPEGLRPAMEALAVELGVASDITFLGGVAPDEMPPLYERATVVCQPSFGEPFGMTVVEAMAAGRPVVGTAAGGIPDAIVDGAGGRLVSPGDPRTLADALCWVLEDPSRAPAMGVFNRRRAEERYALGAVLDRVESIYRTVADRKVADVS